jgi:putative glycolipid-binding protein
MSNFFIWRSAFVTRSALREFESRATEIQPRRRMRWPWLQRTPWRADTALFPVGLRIVTSVKREASWKSAEPAGLPAEASIHRLAEVGVMVNKQRIVRWRDWEGQGIEHLVLTEKPSLIVAEGTVLGGSGEKRFAVHYRMGCDPSWTLLRGRRPQNRAYQ